MITRDEFIAEFDRIMFHHGKSCHDDSHPLWLAEKQFEPRVFCNWFVCVDPACLSSLPELHGWCDTTLAGKALCFCSDPDAKEEWWGFAEEADAIIWSLRWGSSRHARY